MVAGGAQESKGEIGERKRFRRPTCSLFLSSRILPHARVRTRSAPTKRVSRTREPTALALIRLCPEPGRKEGGGVRAAERCATLPPRKSAGSSSNALASAKLSEEEEEEEE